MADYIMHNGELINYDELMHYGVIGMKWGVRKGRTAQDYQKEYGKASKKLKKLDKKFNKKEQKTMGATAKADRKLYSRFASEKSKQKALKKLNESRREMFKAARKGEKWTKRMEKAFAKVEMPLTEEDREIAKKFIETMRLRALR